MTSRKVEIINSIFNFLRHLSDICHKKLNLKRYISTFRDVVLTHVQKVEIINSIFNFLQCVSKKHREEFNIEFIISTFRDVKFFNDME